MSEYRPEKIDFSVVAPIYNEEENLPELHRRVSNVMERLGTFEIVLVDDGSRDRSWEIIRDLNRKDPRVKGISFSRNFGHHIAITAGIDHARGDAVILMDGDLQDQPEEIPKLLNKMKEGYDLVFGIRNERHDSPFKNLSSFIFWKSIKRLSGIEIVENQSMLRVMSRRYVESFKRITERNRFLGGLFAWTGFDQVAVEIVHAPRHRGKSKYNLWRMLKLTFNAITSFSYFPLQLAGYTGLAISASSFIFGSWLIVRKLLFGISVAGWASLMVAVLFTGGVQLIVLWLMGEYIGRVFSEVQRRPMYLIKDMAE